jgi:hypothetical protein
LFEIAGSITIIILKLVFDRERRMKRAGAKEDDLEVVVAGQQPADQPHHHTVAGPV